MGSLSFEPFRSCFHLWREAIGHLSDFFETSHRPISGAFLNVKTFVLCVCVCMGGILDHTVELIRSSPVLLLQLFLFADYNYLLSNTNTLPVPVKKGSFFMACLNLSVTEILIFLAGWVGVGVGGGRMRAKNIKSPHPSSTVIGYFH